MKKIKPIIIFIVLLLGMTFFSYIPMTIFQIDINEMSEQMKISYMFACDLGFIIIILVAYREKVINDTKEFFKKFRSHFKTNLKYYLIGLVAMIFFNLLISQLFKNASATNEEMVRSFIKLYPIYMLFSVSVYAPIVEETIFRRSIKDCFKVFKDNKILKYVYVISSGFIFGAMHIVGSTELLIDYVYILPYMSLGMALAMMYNKHENLWDSAFFHALHNLIALGLLLGFGV